MAADPKRRFGVRLVDPATGRGVPLAELETVHKVRFVSDSAGWIAIDDPGLMGRETFFLVRSHGYAFPKDGFGFAGTRLKVVPGGRVTLKLPRVQIAERACRLTGEGLYRDSLLLGYPAPLRQPLLAAGVVGQDSAQAVVYRGRWRWFWGDTSRIEYPLGNFRTTGATARLPRGRTDPGAGLDFAYATRSDGRLREMLPTDRPGVVWLSGLCVVDGAMMAYAARMKDLGTKLEHGHVVWDDRAGHFRFLPPLASLDSWRHLEGHPVAWDGRIGGGFTFPTARVGATRASVLDEAQWEALTCLDASGAVARVDGRPHYRWQRALPPIEPMVEEALVKAGALSPDEARFLWRGADGSLVVPHGGGVTWSAHRRRWIAIATQRFGKPSSLGELWYAEADTPVGPFGRAVKIATHDNYTFYNPVRHPFLDSDGGRTVWFEGTYTDQFADRPTPTPRYDYNQILFRLDLDDPRLHAAQERP